MKNKNNLGGNRNISEKTCSFIYFKSDYDRINKKTIAYKAIATNENNNSL